jgi:hypothetical protein
MRRKGRTGTLRVELHLGADRPAGARRLDRDLGQGQRIEGAGIRAGRIGLAVLPFDRFGADVPDHRSAPLKLILDLLGCLHRRHAGGKDDAAAAGHMG